MSGALLEPSTQKCGESSVTCVSAYAWWAVVSGGSCRKWYSETASALYVYPDWVGGSCDLAPCLHSGSVRAPVSGVAGWCVYCVLSLQSHFGEPYFWLLLFPFILPSCILAAVASVATSSSFFKSHSWALHSFGIRCLEFYQ